MFRAILPRVPAVARSGIIRSTPVLRTARQAAAWHGVRFDSNLSDKEKTQRRALHDAKDALQRDWDAKVLSYEELKPRTQQPQSDSFLIDVREPDEVLQGSIPSSVNLPLSVLAGSLHLKPEEFHEKFGFPLPKKNQEIIFYCRSGVRSTSACDVAKRNGYTNILNYKGSWLEWLEKEGKPSS
ncbi:Rhodanese-like protein [Cristinia sonorae]|uniref:Rhodanese-like protein n=1 Tax=Cristinia sonorae TaxID=1940300 RepID=A0A8K0XPW8_9AGAR|nr:Rhodanese-like protein [Cristinia sonorae]